MSAAQISLGRCAASGSSLKRLAAIGSGEALAAAIEDQTRVKRKPNPPLYDPF
jgi:hypothetical protein